MFHEQVTQFIAAYNAHDAVAIGGLIAPGGMQEDVPLERVNTTQDELTAGLSPFFHAVPDAHWHEDQRIASGKSVVVIYTLMGHLQNDLGPFKARGQKFALPGVFVLKFDEGRLMAAQDFWEPQEFGRQVD
jgi:steroid delta-isomerase-like uncharacterized protein